MRCGEISFELYGTKSAVGLEKTVLMCYIKQYYLNSNLSER